MWCGLEVVRRVRKLVWLAVVEVGDETRGRG